MVLVQLRVTEPVKMPLKKKLKLTDGQELKEKKVQKNFAPYWHETVVGMCNRYRHARQKSIWTDMTFMVGKEAIPFPAHKLIMALNSPVFEAMFYGPLAEKGDRIVIPDVAPDGFTSLLEYIYTEVVSFDSEKHAYQAWYAADKYCIPGLKDQCENFFNTCPIDIINVWKKLEIALFFNIRGLKKRCNTFLADNADKSVLAERFLSISEDTLKNFLELNGMNLDEVTLSIRLVKWGKERVKKQQSPTLQEALKPLMGYIRLEYFTPKQFCLFLDLSPGLFSDADSLKILKHLAFPTTYHLPDWCCRRGSRRSSITKAYDPKRKAVYSRKFPCLTDNIEMYRNYVSGRSCQCPKSAAADDPSSASSSSASSSPSESPQPGSSRTRHVTHTI